MERLVFFILPVLIAACGIEPTPFVGPNGNTAYSMRCSGMGRSLDACFVKAGEICPSGYNIIDRSTGVVGLPTAQGTMIGTTESMAIECK